MYLTQRSNWGWKLERKKRGVSGQRHFTPLLLNCSELNILTTAARPGISEHSFTTIYANSVNPSNICVSIFNIRTSSFQKWINWKITYQLFFSYKMIFQTKVKQTFTMLVVSFLSCVIMDPTAFLAWLNLLCFWLACNFVVLILQAKCIHQVILAGEKQEKRPSSTDQSKKIQHKFRWPL